MGKLKQDIFQKLSIDLENYLGLQYDAENSKKIVSLKLKDNIPDELSQPLQVFIEKITELLPKDSHKQKPSQLKQNVLLALNELGDNEHFKRVIETNSQLSATFKELKSLSTSFEDEEPHLREKFKKELAKLTSQQNGTLASLLAPHDCCISKEEEIANTEKAKKQADQAMNLLNILLTKLLNPEADLPFGGFDLSNLPYTLKNRLRTLEIYTQNEEFLQNRIQNMDPESLMQDRIQNMDPESLMQALIVVAPFIKNTREMNLVAPDISCFLKFLQQAPKEKIFFQLGYGSVVEKIEFKKFHLMREEMSNLDAYVVDGFRSCGFKNDLLAMFKLDSLQRGESKLTDDGVKEEFCKNFPSASQEAVQKRLDEAKENYKKAREYFDKKSQQLESEVQQERAGSTIRRTKSDSCIQSWLEKTAPFIAR